MFTPQKPRSYSVEQMLQQTTEVLNKMEIELTASRSNLMSLLKIFREAVKLQEEKCKEMPDQPISKRFFSDFRDKMLVYPSEEIRDSPLYKKTYGDCKAYIKEIESTNQEFKINIEKAITLIEHLEEELALLKHVKNKTTKLSVLNAKSNVHDGEWLLLSDICEWDYRDELHSMRHNVCMLMEFVTTYPYSDESKSAHRELRQLVFYWLAPTENDPLGVWLFDKTGNGNYHDFVEVDSTSPFMQLYDSKAAYLTSQFKYYVDVMHRKHYERKNDLDI